MYALVMNTEDFEFLIDPRELWKPPRVLVRRGAQEAHFRYRAQSFPPFV